MLLIISDCTGKNAKYGFVNPYLKKRLSNQGLVRETRFGRPQASGFYTCIRVIPCHVSPFQNLAHPICRLQSAHLFYTPGRAAAREWLMTLTSSIHVTPKTHLGIIKRLSTTHLHRAPYFVPRLYGKLAKWIWTHPTHTLAMCDR